MLGRIPIPSTLAHEQGLVETIWLLLTTVLVVPAVCKLPGGSPVLGFLAGGALIGPHALGALPPPRETMGQSPDQLLSCIPTYLGVCATLVR